MKVEYTPNDKVKFHIDAETEKGVFEALASLQEVFGDIHCPIAGSKQNIRFLVREVDGNKFYELQCQDTFAKFVFGSNKEGGSLFPKRKMDKSTGEAPYWQPAGKACLKKTPENVVYDNKFGGWHIYDKNKTKAPAAG